MKISEKMFSGFNFEFHSPWFLLLFLAYIPLLIKDFQRTPRAGVLVPSTKNMTETGSYRLILLCLRFTKYALLSALIVAMARPRTFTVTDDDSGNKGVTIIMAVDVSLSMLAKDLEPDRLTALKGIAQDFVKERPADRIGLVTYSGEAIAKVPATTDHQVLLDELANLNPLELQPGTAIGEGLSVAVNHLKNVKSRSKVVILMTDGVNTIQNAMPPQTAAQLAKSNGIKVYTIGIGTNGYALFPTQQDPFTGELIFTQEEVKIDEPALRDIAEMTGGKYFRATSNESLAQVYSEINRMEKSEVKTSKSYNYREYFRIFLWFGLFVLMLDAALRWIFFKTAL